PDVPALGADLVAADAARGAKQGQGIGASPSHTSTTSSTSTTSNPSTTSPGGGGRGGGGRYVRARHVHGPALRLQERDHRPDLLRRQLARHDGHDGLIAGDDVGGGVVERLEQVLFAGLPRLAAAAARADRSLALLVRQQVRGAGAEAVARGTAADAVVDLLA